MPRFDEPAGLAMIIAVRHHEVIASDPDKLKKYEIYRIWSRGAAALSDTILVAPLSRPSTERPGPIP